MPRVRRCARARAVERAGRRSSPFVVLCRAPGLGACMFPLCWNSPLAPTRTSTPGACASITTSRARSAASESLGVLAIGVARITSCCGWICRVQVQLSQIVDNLRPIRVCADDNNKRETGRNATAANISAAKVTLSPRCRVSLRDVLLFRTASGTVE